MRLPEAPALNKYDTANEQETRRAIESAFNTLPTQTVSASGSVFFDAKADYGAVADSVTDDTAALLAAVTAAAAAGTGGVVYLGPGIYRVTGDWLPAELRSVRIVGSDRYRTIIRSTAANTPTFKANGLWFSRFEGIRFETTATQTNNGVVEIDGNYDGTHTLGVQGNTFFDCYFVGGTYAKYSLAMVRQGMGGGQGSENLFLNCHFEGGNEACYGQFGLNSLTNTFMNCNFQAFPKHGITAFGSLNVFSCAFQSTYGYAQVLNGGWDINIANGGSGDRISIDGCRSESLRFCNASASQPATIRSFTHIPAIASWSDGPVGSTIAVDTVVTGVTSGERKLYRVTTAGIKGATEPAWPSSGTVVDGTITWTQTDFNVIDIAIGMVEHSYVQLGQVAGQDPTEFRFCYFRRRDPFPVDRFSTAGYNPQTAYLFYANVGGTPEPIKFGNQPTVLSAVTALNIADSALASISGVGGGTSKPIAIYRGHHDFNYDVLNWWEVRGGIRHLSVTFAEVNAFGTAANGVVAGLEIFVSDGTPGDPLTGGGTGCKAYYANGRWKGI